MKCWCRVLAVAVVAALLMASAVAPARAATATIVLSGDRVVFTAAVNVNLTGVPRGECSVYEHFYSMWRNPILKDGFTKVVRNHLERYLRDAMGIENATVESLTIDYSFSKGYHTHAVSPSAVANTTGSLVSGSLSNLTSADGVAMRFESLNSSNTMLIAVDVNFTLPDWVPADKLEEFTIAVVGNLSKTVSDRASIELYNYTSGAYDVLSSTALNVTSSTEVKLSVSEVSGYVKGGVVRLRINVTDVQAAPGTLVYLDLDKAELSFKYFTVSVSVKMKLVLSGISNHTMTQRLYNVKFRAMNPEGTVEYNAFRFSPARLLFMNFKAFDVPLEKWSRSFNGTHTTFSYTVSSMAVYTHGGYTVTVDPEEKIVVEGEATAEGDTIAVRELSEEAWCLIWGVAAVAVAIALALAITRTLKHTAAELKATQRRFVRRKSG